MSKGRIETSQSPSVSRPPILLHWNCTSPPCLNVTPISGVHTGHRGWWSTIELSEIIWPSQKLSGEVLKLTVSTIGGSIARVEMEFQHLGHSLAAAAQVELNKQRRRRSASSISIPAPTAAHILHHDSHLCDALSHSSLIIANALLVLNPTTPPKLPSDSTQLTQLSVSK